MSSVSSDMSLASQDDEEHRHEPFKFRGRRLSIIEFESDDNLTGVLVSRLCRKFGSHHPREKITRFDHLFRTISLQLCHYETYLRQMCQIRDSLNDDLSREYYDPEKFRQELETITNFFPPDEELTPPFIRLMTASLTSDDCFEIVDLIDAILSRACLSGICFPPLGCSLTDETRADVVISLYTNHLLIVKGCDDLSTFQDLYYFYPYRLCLKARIPGIKELLGQLGLGQYIET